MIETAVSVFADLWSVGPFRAVVYIAAAASVMAWAAGQVERVKNKKNPPAWIHVVEYPVYFAAAAFSVALNFTFGWIWGPPTRDTLTFTKRLEHVLSHKPQYKRWQVTIAQWCAWWVNVLWLGHIKNA